MKIYLASRYDRREELAGIARLLEAQGHHVTSRWLEGHGAPDADSALYDLTDVIVADALVLFTEEPTAHVAYAARGGRHVEFGYALRAGKRMFVVGPRENIFHELPEVTVLPDVETLLCELGRIAEAEVWS
jgi:hypothetical protein